MLAVGRGRGRGTDSLGRGTAPLPTANRQLRPDAAPLYDVLVTFVRALRHLAIAEGISTLVLFGIAMPLKYFAGMPLAVRIVGSLHGALFVALVVMLLLAIRKVPISFGVAAAGIVAAVIPGGPFLLDRHLARIDG